MRYVLVDGQGNFGSVDGDPPAAYRYTEARLQALAEAMMTDLDKDTVDFRPTFDETNDEPVVLPTPFPNLLINGSTGIAVGMATSIPPHNMREVIDGVIAVIERRHASADEKFRALLQAIPGAGFPFRRHDRRPRRHRARLQDRPRRLHAARQGDVRGIEEGRARVDRHHGDSLPGQQGDPGRRHRRTRAREEDRGHFRPARRIEPRRHAHRRRAEARRAAGRRPEQPVPAHQAADELRHHAAGDRRRAAAGAEPARD